MSVIGQHANQDQSDRKQPREDNSECRAPVDMGQLLQPLGQHRGDDSHQHRTDHEGDLHADIDLPFGNPAEGFCRSHGHQ